MQDLRQVTLVEVEQPITDEEQTMIDMALKIYSGRDSYKLSDCVDVAFELICKVRAKIEDRNAAAIEVETYKRRKELFKDV